MSFNFKVTMGVLVAAAALTGGASTLQASDTCSNVHFSVTNQRSATIKLLRVIFKNSDSGKTRTENLSNLECAAGRTCTTSGDNLTDAEGRNLSSAQFVFRHREGDGDWSDEVTSANFAIPAAQQRCSAGKTYGPFTITR